MRPRKNPFNLGLGPDKGSDPEICYHFFPSCCEMCRFSTLHVLANKVRIVRLKNDQRDENTSIFSPQNPIHISGNQNSAFMHEAKNLAVMFSAQWLERKFRLFR